jgi:hypothetical protein
LDELEQALQDFDFELAAKRLSHMARQVAGQASEVGSG